VSYRKDRNITREIAPYRRMLAHVTPSRDQASVFFTQTIDVTETLAWIEDEKQRTGRKMSFLMVYMAAVGRMLHANPRINRYVSGWKFYERSDVTLSVSAKKSLRNGAKIVILKVPMQADDTPMAVLDRFEGMLKEGRQTEEIAQEKEYRLFLYIPNIVLSWVVKLATWLDRLHWLPGALVDPDGMYTSMVIANLGSVGLDAAYHHLYEWGTATYFAVIGRIHEQPVVVDGQVVVRKVVEVKYTFDERVEDGLATAIAMSGVRELIENPARFAEGGITDLDGRPPERVSV